MIDTGDTAWVLISAALVFVMTPGLAFFYGGMVRSKNVLTTIMQSFFIVAMISVEWVILGYAMTFGTDIGGFIGSLDKVGLAGVGLNVLENGTIPELAFVAFQCMFAVITPALITGAFAERMRFAAFAVLILLWAIFIYNPMAHWVWGGGFLAELGALDFSFGSAGSASTPARLSAQTASPPTHSSRRRQQLLLQRSPGYSLSGTATASRPSSVRLLAASPASLPSRQLPAL